MIVERERGEELVYIEVCRVIEIVCRVLNLKVSNKEDDGLVIELEIEDIYIDEIIF